MLQHGKGDSHSVQMRDGVRDSVRPKTAVSASVKAKSPYSEPSSGSESNNSAGDAGGYLWHSGRSTEMAGQGQDGDGDYDDQNPNGPVYQEKVERPITRVGSRQKTVAGSASQQQPNGRSGTGRNASSGNRPRPPSPEPSEAGGGHSDDEVHYDELGHSQLEGFARARTHTRTKKNVQRRHSYEQDDGDCESIDSVDETLRDFLNLKDYTNMSSMEFSKMLAMFPENVNMFPDPENLESTELAAMDERDLQLHTNLEERRWVDVVLERKRNEIGAKAKCSGNPGIHNIRNQGTYNPEDYVNLNTTPEIKQLFEYITTYLPSANMTPETKFKPFIREYEASVGDIDAFLKVVHPDITNDGLGIKVLDEPSAFQSDPSVLDLRLRAMAKQSSAKAIVVKKVENAHKNPKIIENWIKDISDLHRSKPSPSVHYSKPMPDIDLLLQEWPPEFEELLKSVTTPTAQLDCDLKTYVDLVCNVLDIPVYKSRIQSLHVLATLYATHKNFNSYGPAFGPIGSEPPQRLAPSASNSLRTEENNIDRMEF